MDLNTKFEEPGVTIPNFTTTSPWPIPNDNTSSMIIPTFLLLAICFVGVIGNFCIAWVTFRGKEFRSTCYTFIAFNAITSIIMELWNISYVHYAIKATYYTVWDCWYIGIVPAFCMNASIMLTVVTSGDRLFSIMAPSPYLEQQRR
uniref:G-protein coupled receptors family 1 profile domain-containing protein n=1 Tax=Acrobeloides nanus TaxID=290746 RepID=A0A914DAS0_9BILA